MMNFKRALGYFQGTKDPKEDKKEHKEKQKFPKPQFETPLFKNYDYTESSSGPGAGYNSMHEYKSVSEFLEKKRKRNKDKYKSNNEDAVKYSSRYNQILKLALDFPDDIQINNPIINTENSASPPIGGKLDQVLPVNDEEDKTPDQLNFSQDYDKYPKINKLLDTLLTPKEPPLNGLKDGMEQQELDPSETISTRHQDYADTNTGNFTYKNISLA